MAVRSLINFVSALTNRYNLGCCSASSGCLHWDLNGICPHCACVMGGPASVVIHTRVRFSALQLEYHIAISSRFSCIFSLFARLTLCRKVSALFLTA